MQEGHTQPQDQAGVHHQARDRPGQVHDRRRDRTRRAHPPRRDLRHRVCPPDPQWRAELAAGRPPARGRGLHAHAHYPPRALADHHPHTRHDHIHAAGRGGLRDHTTPGRRATPSRLAAPTRRGCGAPSLRAQAGIPSPASSKRSEWTSCVRPPPTSRDCSIRDGPVTSPVIATLLLPGQLQPRTGQ